MPKKKGPEGPDFVERALATLHAEALVAGAPCNEPGKAAYEAHLHGIESPPRCTAKPCRLGGLCLALFELTQYQREALLSMAFVDAAKEAANMREALDRFLVTLAPVVHRVAKTHWRVALHDHSVCASAIGVLPLAIELTASLDGFADTMRRHVWSQELQQPRGKKKTDLLLIAMYQHLKWGGLKHAEMARLVLGDETKGAADRVRARLKSPDARSMHPHPPPEK